MSNESHESLLKRAALGLSFPIFTGLYGFIKGFCCFIVDPRNYFYNRDRERGDNAGRTTPFLVGLSRIGVIVVTIVCLFGFFGSLGVPFPGVSPACAAGMISVVKAHGLGVALMENLGFWPSFLNVMSITSFWAMLIGRGGGALLGACVDAVAYPIIINKKRKISADQKVPLKEGTYSRILKRICCGVPLVLLFGEAGPALTKKATEYFKSPVKTKHSICHDEHKPLWSASVLSKVAHPPPFPTRSPSRRSAVGS